MKLKNILLVLLIALSYVSGFSQKENVKRAMKEAVKELKNDKSDYTDAIKIHEKVVVDGLLEDEDLFIKIAKSYYFNSNYSKAAKWFGKYYKIDNIKPLPIYDYWYGQSLKVLNKYRKADSLLAPYYQSKGQRYIYSTDNLKTIPNNIDRYEMLPFKYNTPFSDYSAYLHKDRLYFITSIGNGNKLGWVNNNTSDIFFIDDSNVEVQKTYGDLNSKFNEGSLVITKDGKTMYFTRNAFLKNKYKKNKKGEPRTIALNIYRAELIDLKWENITPLSINNPNYSVGHPALSADEKTLYFSSDMPGGKGLTDLYSVSINENGSLGKPKNLEALNTVGKEMFPFVDHKTDILYFSSDRPSSLGGLDVFLSELEWDETYKIAYNVGKPINSSFDDFGYMINAEKKGYFSSNRREESDNVEDQLDQIYSFVETKPFSFPVILAKNDIEKDFETTNTDVKASLDVDVPFSVIENAPVFPGCERADNKKVCFNKMMLKHVSKNIRYPDIAKQNGVQGSVSVLFVIQKDGSIGSVKINGPDKDLEKEAARIIAKLPKMTSAKQRGRAVRVPFSIPIKFMLQ